MKEQPKRLWIIFVILGSLLIFSLIASVFFISGNENLGYNTAVIPIQGEITTDGGSSIFNDYASSTDLVQEIEKAKNDPNVKAIIFEINSPGGSPVATDEISEEIKSLKADNITTVAWIREEGASGAYWIASSTNHIVADRMSIVGSIGVYGSYLEYSGLLKDYNVTYERLVSGEYKDTGTPYRPLSSAEEALLQDKLDKLHGYFIEAVAENRNMSVDSVTKLATGEIFLGSEAKDNGLIDELGGKTEAQKYIESKLNITVTSKDFTQKKSFIESLMQAMNKNSFYIGQGISSGLVKDTGVKITT